MNGQTSTRPAEIERPQITEQQVEQRFQRRYEIAVDELFRSSVLPEVQRFNGLLEQELRRVNIRYFNEDDATFPAAVQQAVDRVSEQYMQQYPNTLLSLYLSKYTIQFTVDHEPVEGAVPKIAVDENLLRTEFSMAANALREPGKPFSDGNIWSLFNPNFIPGAREFNDMLADEVSEVRPTYKNMDDPEFPATVQSIVDNVSERYLEVYPNGPFSAYLRQYSSPPFMIDHEPVEGAVPVIKIDEGLLRAELPVKPGNSQRTLTCDVNAHTLEGALAVNLAANLNKFLQRPINKFRHQASDEQQPGLQIVMRVDRDPQRADLMGITFSRT